MSVVAVAIGVAVVPPGGVTATAGGCDCHIVMVSRTNLILSLERWDGIMSRHHQQVN